MFHFLHNNYLVSGRSLCGQMCSKLVKLCLDYSLRDMLPEKYNIFVHAAHGYYYPVAVNKHLNQYGKNNFDESWSG